MGVVKHFSLMGLNVNYLIHCKKVVIAVANRINNEYGNGTWEFEVNHKNTKQALHICIYTSKLYFSKKAFINVG